MDCVCADYDYCSGVKCPTGGKCTSLSANFTYNCNCTDGYDVTGILSASNPLIQSCGPSISVAVVLAIVIPIAFGILVILIIICVVFFVRQ